MALIFVVVLGMIAVYGLSRWMDEHRPQASAAVEEEKLYLTGQAARRVSLSFNGLIADWYWMRALQYVGRKVLKHEAARSHESAQPKVQLDDLGSLDLRLLYPLLDTTTTLDPQFMAAYEYGAVVLPEINVDDAIRLLQKGISANPSAWQLYHHLGYIYWQRGDYARAGEIYHEGARDSRRGSVDGRDERAHVDGGRQPRDGARDVRAHVRAIGRRAGQADGRAQIDAAGLAGRA